MKDDNELKLWGRKTVRPIETFAPGRNEAKPQSRRYVVRARFETRTLLIQVTNFNGWLNLFCRWMLNVRLVIECILFWLQAENSGCLFEFPKSCVFLLWGWVEQKVFFYHGADTPQWAWAFSLSRLQSVGFTWTSEQPNAETSTWQHTTLQTST